MSWLLACLVLLLTAACGGDRDPSVSPDSALSRADPPGTAVSAAWRSAPREGVRIEGGDPVLVEAGPHAIAFPAGQESLAPPYAVKATLHKRSGRLYEGYGLVFGGDPLDASPGEQRYSYFLIRGDGSYLIKRREGETTPVVRDWTAHPAIRRDNEAGGQPNTLAVQVGGAEVTFWVNGAEVARVPAAELRTHGGVGIRIAHGVRLAVDDFRVEPDSVLGLTP